MRQQAVMSPPELVLVETSPDGIFFNVQDKLGVAFDELHDFRFHDGRNAVAAGPHSGTVNRISAINKSNGPNQGAAIGRIKMHFFAQAVEQDFDVFNDRIAFSLIRQTSLLWFLRSYA